MKIVIIRMTTETQTLRCSDCKCRKLPEYFSKNVRGVLYKTCDKCRHRHKCEQCDFTNPKLNALVLHKKRVHEKLRDFICDDCKKPFTSSSNLQTHIKAVHLKIKDHICQECDESFYNNQKLLRHIKTVHLNIRDHHCPHCDYSFSNNSQLQQHIKAVHLNIKDHHCQNCDYSCCTNGQLQRHIKTCTGPNYTPLSGLEMRCKEALTDLGFIEDVDYIYNHTFSKLSDYCGQRLRPDFRFLNHKIMIECDGSQHYKVKEFGSSKKEVEINFEKTKANDKVKDEFCDKFCYKMIRIPYWNIMNILQILSVELYDITEW